MVKVVIDRDTCLTITGIEWRVLHLQRPWIVYFCNYCVWSPLYLSILPYHNGCITHVESLTTLKIQCFFPPTNKVNYYYQIHENRWFITLDRQLQKRPIYFRQKKKINWANCMQLSCYKIIKIRQSNTIIHYFPRPIFYSIRRVILTKEIPFLNIICI